MTLYGLSEREMQVLSLCVAGYTKMQVANELFVSVLTVGAHLAHIAAKMGVATAEEAIQRATDEGLA